MKAQSILLPFALILALSFFSACKKKKPANVQISFAQVSTSPVTGITDISAIAGGAVLTEGSSAVVETGVCFDTLPEPRINKGVTVKSTALGNYTCALSGLKSYTTYYLRAYASTALGTSYGAEITFRTSDNWVKQKSASSPLQVNCMKASGNNLFMGTQYGVYYSSDGGENWQNVGLNTSTVMAIAVQGNTVVAGLSDHAIYKSIDNGTTWTKIFSEIAAPFIMDILIVDNVIYTCETEVVYISKDLGATWQKTKPADYVQFTRLAYSKNTVFAYGPGPLLFRSIDQGATWEQAPRLLVFDISGYNYDFDCTDTRLLMSTSKGMYFSSDAGSTWQQQPDLPSLGSAISVSGTDIFSFVNTNVGGSISTDSGGTWSQVTKKGFSTQYSITDAVICPKAMFVYNSYGKADFYRYRR